MILRKARFEYDLARSGPEAIALYCEREYALVLMDLCMPEMDGYATALRLRQLEIEGKVNGDGGRRTPIVAVSACSEEEILSKCHASGMQAFVPKPVTHVALLDVLETWIGPQLDSGG